MEQPDDVGAFTLDPLDPMLNEQVSLLAAMHYRYMLEELDRTGRAAAGFPLAPWLTTLFIRWQGSALGFVAIDVSRRSIELIYVDAPYRGQGLATAALESIAGPCPELLAMKAPLTPAAAALTARLGLPVTESTPEQVADGERFLTALEQGLRKRCRHKTKSGHPGRPCKRCYRDALQAYTENLIVKQTTAIRTAAATA